MSGSDLTTPSGLLQAIQRGERARLLALPSSLGGKSTPDWQAWRRACLNNRGVRSLDWVLARLPAGEGFTLDDLRGAHQHGGLPMAPLLGAWESPHRHDTRWVMVLHLALAQADPALWRTLRQRWEAAPLAPHSKRKAPYSYSGADWLGESLKTWPGIVQALWNKDVARVVADKQPLSAQAGRHWWKNWDLLAQEAGLSLTPPGQDKECALVTCVRLGYWGLAEACVDHDPAALVRVRGTLDGMGHLVKAVLGLPEFASSTVPTMGTPWWPSACKVWVNHPDTRWSNAWQALRDGPVQESARSSRLVGDHWRNLHTAVRKWVQESAQQDLEIVQLQRTLGALPVAAPSVRPRI